MPCPTEPCKAQDELIREKDAMAAPKLALNPRPKCPAERGLGSGVFLAGLGPSLHRRFRTFDFSYRMDSSSRGSAGSTAARSSAPESSFTPELEHPVDAT